MKSSNYRYRLLCINPYKGKLKPEYRLQHVFVNFCRAWSIEGHLKAVWSSTPNEISNNRNPVFGHVLKALGKINGAPDMKFLWKEGSGCLEFKSKKGKLSPEQQLYKQWCEEMNVPYVEVRTLQEAVETLIAWGVLPEKMLEPIKKFHLFDL